MAFFECVANNGTIVDKEFTVLYTRDVSSLSVDTKTISIPADITEVILSTAEPWDSGSVRINSHSDNITQIYSTVILGGGHGKGHLYVFSKKEGQSASINFSVIGGRLIAR